MTGRRASRIAIDIAMNIVLAFALILLARVVVEFFGAIAAAGPVRGFVRLTEPLVPPLGLPSPRTPYGGIFDASAAVTVFVLVLLEWFLSVIRGRA